MMATPILATSADLRDALMAAGLPTDDLAEPGRQFYSFTDEGETIGFGGLELYGEHALLRSLVILPETRGRGLGRRATGLLLEQARAAGVRDVFLLTTDAAPFFEANGFAAIGRDAAPPAILATRQATSLCPSTAALLVRAL